MSELVYETHLKCVARKGLRVRVPPRAVFFEFLTLMKIGFVRIFVTDFKKSLSFYTNKLGLELDYSDDHHWAQFKSGEDVSLAIESCAADHTEQGSRLVGRFAGVTMMVESIAETYEQLSAKGVEFTGKPEKQPWGGTLAHLKDPDGNVLTLMESAD